MNLDDLHAKLAQLGHILNYKYWKLCYHYPGLSLVDGLKIIGNERSISEMLNQAAVYGSIEVYVIHEEFEVEDEFEEERGVDDISEDGSLEFVTDDEELIEVRVSNAQRKDEKLASKKGKQTATKPPSEPPTDPPTEPMTEPPTELMTSPHNEDVDVPIYDVNDGYDTEYADSDDYDTPELESNYECDTHVVNRENPRTNYPIYNPQQDMFTFVPEVGLKFTSPQQLKECLSNYSVANGLSIWYKKNRATQLLALCAPKCPWRLCASYMQDSSTFQIKTLRKVHKCGRNYSVKMGNSKWLAKRYYNKILANPTWKLADFKAEILNEFALEVTTTQCLRAKRKVLGGVDKGLELHYAKVSDYAHEIFRSNSGSTVKIEVDRPNPVQMEVDTPLPVCYFQRMYVCFHSLKKGWLEGCRPVLGLDDCFLKGFVKGELLTTVGRDGNNQMFPIAWAQVESENKDSWCWFLDRLLNDFNILDGQGWTAITDQ
ncbi:hypothetical protein IFM89_029298 [Coptis chinensis]|uniref:Transposase MuDR plant domain-containing protein n=1 Tax=Coptis chinensis TaxID=261450 RepID=A0A835HW66_9MAGN|nr:hypothetical protein IFM89_029298 [Coptis chinensis]